MNPKRSAPEADRCAHSDGENRGLDERIRARRRSAFATRAEARGMSRVYGAAHDLEHAVGTHLFGICPNNSGTTFLKQALATCRATWNLEREGQRMLGFVGPATWQEGHLLWAADRRWLDRFGDTSLYDWPRTRKAWYFQAYARDPAASVFYVKTPPFLLYVGELARNFRNAKFLFMVRNPYAACEAICRRRVRVRRSELDMDIREAAATHMAICLDYQRRNVETHGERGVFFTYEAMCDEPERVEREIRSLVPELDDPQVAAKAAGEGRVP